MNVWGLLSWYSEHPAHLRRAVTSLKGFADHIVAVDGAYKTFPGGKPWSDLEEQVAIRHAARDAGLECHIRTTAHRWDSEVAKRAFMFEYARQMGATPDDWFLIIDGDMALAEFSSEARDKLAAADLDVAEVRWRDVQINGVPCSDHRFRSLFRALPGLTVERTHFLYTAPQTTDESCNVDLMRPSSFIAGRRFLWHLPSGHISDEPALDLFGDVTLHHFNSGRDPERRQRALDYYQDRDARTLESAGDWR